MVRRSFTAVLERNSTFDSNFETEPYEAGWASEARCFVRVLAASGADASMTVIPQLSPDGLCWCDEESVSLQMKAAGLRTFALREFGNWFRLRGEVRGEGASFKVIIYLALKE